MRCRICGRQALWRHFPPSGFAFRCRFSHGGGSSILQIAGAFCAQGCGKRLFFNVPLPKGGRCESPFECARRFNLIPPLGRNNVPPTIRQFFRLNFPSDIYDFAPPRGQEKAQGVFQLALRFSVRFAVHSAAYFREGAQPNVRRAVLIGRFRPPVFLDSRRLFFKSQQSLDFGFRFGFCRREAQGGNLFWLKLVYALVPHARSL